MRLAWALLLCVGCPGAPAFEGTDVADTSVAETAEDTDADSACENLCPSDMQYGSCGPSACGECLCSSASLCDVDLCQAIVNYETGVGTVNAGPLAAVVNDHGQAVVASLDPRDDESFDTALRRFGGSDWSLETPTPTATSDAQERSVALGRDETDTLHGLVASGPIGAARTHWLHRGTTDWQLDPFLGKSTCARPQLRRDDGGVLYGSCHDDVNEVFVIARFDNADTPDPMWSVVATYILPVFVSWTLDAPSRPRIAFVDEAGELRSALWNGDQWVDETIASNALGLSAIAVDGDGRAHVVYQAIAFGFLTLSDSVEDGLDWTSEELARADGTNGVGRILLMESDTRQRLHLVYQDDDKLKYRRWDDEWSVPLVSPSTIDPFEVFATLTIDPGDTPHVAYWAAGQIRWWTPPDPGAR